MDVFMLKSYTRSKGSKGGTRQGRRPWPLPGGTLRGRLACVASVSVLFPSKDRAKNGRAVWLSFHFSRGQNRESRSSVFLCSETARKRLLRRLGGGGLKSQIRFWILRYVLA